MEMARNATTLDDVSLMEEAIDTASQNGSRYSAESVIRAGLRGCIGKGALSVLRFLLDTHKADITGFDAQSLYTYECVDPAVHPSRELLELMISHDWDINTQGPRGTEWPLLWRVVKFPEQVVWCLELGAKVDVPDANPNRSTFQPRPELLDIVAESASIHTFELLRSKGAPLSPRTLHFAVRIAAMCAPKRQRDDFGKPWNSERLDMVRHLVEVVKLDVDAVVHQVGTMCSTPLCVTAGLPGSRQHDVSEIVRILMDAGADPCRDGGVVQGVEFPSPIACAKSSGNESFLWAVEQWRMSDGEDGGSG